MAQYVHNYIRDEIISNCSETNVYIGNFNEDNDNIVCLNYYNSNISDSLAFGKTTIARYPYLQILVRDASHENAWLRMETIREYFKAYSFQNFSMYPKSDIHYLGKGKDEKKRTILTLNFAIMLINGVTTVTP
jgi:hypothetical protein